ncbi:MAG: chorismate mutase [bacterium]|nr:chorismate mutase [bacterium]
MDTVDDGILDLILRRVELVDEITAAKTEAGTLHRFLRPGREAIILRRLLARNRGIFPPAALVRIWREMLCALLPLQGTFSVVVGGSETGLRDTARDFYGSSTLMPETEDATTAMNRVAEGRDRLAVIPASDHDALRLLASQGRDALHIVALLPFVPPAPGSGSRCEAFVLSATAPEPSGDDRTVIAVFDDSTDAVSQARITTLDGWHQGNDERRITMDSLTGMVLGSYPAPFQQ